MILIIFGRIRSLGSSSSRIRIRMAYKY